jgi:DNA-binding transcriptional LysR family regulator
MFTERGQLRPVVAVASSSFHQMRYVIASGQLLGVLPHSIAKAGEAGGDLAILRPKQVSKIAPISLITRGDIDHLHALLDLERIAIQTAKNLMLA